MVVNNSLVSFFLKCVWAVWIFRKTDEVRGIFRFSIIPIHGESLFEWRYYIEWVKKKIWEGREKVLVNSVLMPVLVKYNGVFYGHSSYKELWSWEIKALFWHQE